MDALHLLPAPLHRQLLRLAHRIRVCWWQVVKPQIEGCRVIGVDADGRVLLVRHAYGSPMWMPPGGGVKHGENPALAGAREFEEEVGCRLEQPREIATTFDSFHGARNLVHIIHGTTSGTPRPDGREIAAAAFFALDALPADLARGLAEKLPQWALGVAAPAEADAPPPKP
jgi:8-oxo-dGTP pyrophosphatase MutT (NUDIX family)